MKIAETLLNHCPGLVTSEEAVNSLVMRDVIDFNTGMNLVQKIKSTESADAESAINDKEQPSGFQFPDASEAVVFKTVMDLSSDDDKAAFMKTLNELNLQFQTAFNKKKEEIVKVVSNMVEISEIDATIAKNLMDTIKNEEIVLIKK